MRFSLLKILSQSTTMDQNYRATIPPQPTSRQSYKHAARQISVPAKARAKEYFANSVNPVLNDFLASIATNRPDDVLAYMFAFSRKRLAERQLESSTSLDDVPESTSDNGRDENNAASRIQARHRGRNDRERVAKLKEKLRKNDLLLAQAKEEAAKEAAAADTAEAEAAAAEAAEAAATGTEPVWIQVVSGMTTRQRAAEAAAESEKRVTIWNWKEKRKLSGNSAPFKRNLQKYLKRHPD